VQWQERRLVVRSVAYAKAQHQALEKRLKKGQAEIAALNERRQGKKVFTDEAEMRAAGEEIVSRHRVEGLLHLECKTSVKERKVRR
jgi:transposase